MENRICCYKKLPKKRIGVGILLFNESKELLIVKPTYKDHWTLVGGAVDENESPCEGAKREIKEETDLNINNLDFKCIDYISDHDQAIESLQIVFDGGILIKKQIKKINLPEDELSDYKFINFDEASKFLNSRTCNRIKKILSNNQPIYLENGK